MHSHFNALFSLSKAIANHQIEKDANIEAKTKSERTPLHFACQNGSLPIIEYLIVKGANIEAKDEYQKTHLHFACECGHLEIVQYLIDKGTKRQRFQFPKE